MSSRWDRIEPNNTTVDLELGLRAPVADPLWMLARQWQLGEFRGEDAARLVKARVTVTAVPVATFRNEAVQGAPVEALSRARPLESRAEVEHVVDGPAAFRLSADAGLQLARRLDAAGLSSLRALFREAFPLSLDNIDLSVLPARQERELRLLAARGISGAAVAASPKPLIQAKVPTAQQDAAQKVLDAWRDEIGERVREPTERASWIDDALEYRFTVGAHPKEGERVLSARYAGGHLDWYSFDVSPGATHGSSKGASTTSTREVVPAALQYRGMPASRYWEMEDGSVYFGDIAAGPADVARLVVAEFATVSGDDWYIVPVPIERGSLARIDEIRVVDTFGDRHSIASTAANDGSKRVWTMFELTGDPSADDGNTPWLFVPTTVATSLVGRPVEAVTMVRDESAEFRWRTLTYGWRR